MSVNAVSCPGFSWKLPKLSSVPEGMVAGSIVMVGFCDGLMRPADMDTPRPNTTAPAAATAVMPTASLLALASGQPPQRGHDLRINRVLGGCCGGRPVCQHARVRDRHLPAAAPPGDVQVQRGAHHPRRRRRVPADGAPGGTSAGEGLGDKLPRAVPIADDD
jgi:hypothetical protein